jgi:multisubunit Na+/H+ antiporter MnhE subunit
MPTGLALILWVALTAVWIAVTRSFHPTLAVAALATTSLVSCFAIAAWINEAQLLPRARATGRRGRYWCELVGVMLLLTGLALAGVHVAYRLLGPYPTGPIPRHYAIDLLGMAVHVAAARAIVAGWNRFGRRTPNAPGR